MSESDSFIDEVSEEVRKDRLFKLMRKYGWIPIAIVILLVGGTTYNEWQKAQKRASAQAGGDALVAALELQDAGARNAALKELAFDGELAAVAGMFESADVSTPELRAEAVAALEEIASDDGIPEMYRQLATLKQVMVAGTTFDSATRREMLEPLAEPGAPFRLLAEEQLAVIDIENGDAEAAIERLQAILQDGEATADLQQRASQVIVALGGELSAS